MGGPLKLVSTDDGGSQMLDGVRMPTEVRLVDVAALLPYARNAKTHGKAQVAAIARSMQEVGFTNPLLIADGGILAGHGRLLAAKSLGLTRVPCIDLSHLSDNQRRALVLWDNRSAEIDSGYDLEILKLETDDLRAMGIDLEAATGFAEEDLAKLFEGMIDQEPPAGGNPDDVPPVPVDPHSRLGDVWEIAGHRIMCGSALEPKDWDVLMAGEQADVVWTDPPYNVDVFDKHRQLFNKINPGTREGKKARGILNDSMSDDDFKGFLVGAFSALFAVMKTGAPIYVAHADLEAVNFRSTFVDAGFKLSSNLIWRKNIHALSRSDFMWAHEPILYGWKPGSAHKWYGGRKNTSIIDLGDAGPFTRTEDGRYQIRVGDSVLIVSADAVVEERPVSVICEPKPARSDLHPTQKPVALIERLLRNSARPGDIVVDAFGGSGSTAVAAHQLGMTARLMELDPRYTDVIVERMQSFTGERAVHAVTGEPFPREGESRRDPEPAAVALPDDGQPF